MSGITAESVVHEAVRLDAEGRASVGQVALDLSFTALSAATLGPHEWADVAAYLRDLLAREPIRTSPRYAAHRVVLGSLLMDLESYATAAGEPIGLAAELANATSDRERAAIQAKIDTEREAYHRYITDMIEGPHGAAAHARDLERDAAAEAPAAPPAAEPAETAVPWL